MADKKIGVGVVGLGWVTGEHIKAWKNNPNCEIVAISSHSKDNALNVQNRHGLAGVSIYTDWADIMLDDRVDVVDICSMNHMHTPQAIAAAEAGKHVLIEKPVSNDLDGLRRVETAITKAGVKSLVSFVLHWSPYFESIDSMIDGDFFGRLFYAECDYFSANWGKYYGSRWVNTKEKGGSALPAAGCHAVDAIRHFARSEPKEVFAYSDNFTKLKEWDPTIISLIRFDNGTIGKVACVLEGNCNYQFCLRLHGTKGMIVGDRFITHYLPSQTDLTKLSVELPDTADVTHHPFQGEIDHLADCILNDRTPMPDIIDAVKTHELIFAAEMSALEGKPIGLPLPR